MKQKSVRVNFIMNMILTISSFIFPIITFPYVSRILSPAGIGKVSFASSVISYFSLFASLGIPTYGIRACAKVRDERFELTKTTQEILLINLVTCGIAYVVFTFSVALIPKLQNDKTLFILLSFSIFLNTLGIDWLYRAAEQYTYITIRSIACKLISLVAVFVLIHEQTDYLLYAAISVFASSASCVLNLYNARKIIDMKPVRHYDFKKHLKPIFVFFAMACATTIYTNLDNVMLGFMTTDADVGYYSTAVKIKTIILAAVTSLGTVSLPRASYFVEQGLMNDFKRLTSKSFSFMFLLSMPLTLYFIFFAKEGIYFLSGDMYEGAVLPMQIIMPTVVLVGLTNVLGIQILLPLGKEKIVLYSEIVGSIVDIVLNAILIPIYASSGAAIGTLAAEFAVLVFQSVALRGYMKEMLKKVHYLRIIISLILASIASIWVKVVDIGNFMTLLLSAILFFAVYGGFLLIRHEEIIVEIWNSTVGKLILRKK